MPSPRTPRDPRSIYQRAQDVIAADRARIFPSSGGGDYEAPGGRHARDPSWRARGFGTETGYVPGQQAARSSASARRVGKIAGGILGVSALAAATYGGYKAYQSRKRKKAAAASGVIMPPNDRLIRKANKAANRRAARFAKKSNRAARKYDRVARRMVSQNESTAVAKIKAGGSAVDDAVKKAHAAWKWARHSPNFHPTKYKMSDLSKLASEGKRRVAGRVALGAAGTLAAVGAYKSYKRKGKNESVEESLSGMMLLAESDFGYSFDDQDEFIVALMKDVAETNDPEVDNYLQEVCTHLDEARKKKYPGLVKRAAYTAAFGKEHTKGEVGEHPGAIGSFGWHAGAELGTAAGAAGVAALAHKKNRAKVIKFAKKHSSAIKHVGAGVAGAGAVLGAHHLISKALQRRKAAKAKAKRGRR